MWVALGKIAAGLLPKDKIVIALIAIPLGFMIILSMFFGSPSKYVEHVPLADEATYQMYISATASINQETGLNINWQDLIAIDAVVLNQDFSKVKDPLKYRKYFVIETTITVPCPSPATGSEAAEDAKEQVCTQIVYSQRSFDDVLELLVKDKIIERDQIQSVKNYVMFELSLSDSNDIEYVEGVQISGNLKIKVGIYAWPLPMENNRLTSGFGMRKHPVTGEMKGHMGIDIAANINTEVYAIADGTVLRAEYIGTGGKSIHIQHEHSVVSKYLHLESYAVNVGQKVKRGDLIGYSGNTGRSTGPHLHFQIDSKGTPINPLRFY